MTTKQCSTCNNDFIPKRPTQVFCGTECQRRRGGASEVTRNCARSECESSFAVPTKGFRKKYCSRSCAAIVNNSRYPKRSLESICKRCGDPCMRGRLYCKVCNDSRGTWFAQEKLSRWKSGDTSEIEYKSGLLSRWAREYLIDLAGNECSECAWGTPNPVLGRPILTIDHIDGNWKNNKFDNLKVLCYNCHTLTPTFGNLNRGSESGTRPNSDKRHR